MDETNEKEPPPLKIDPQWYIGRVASHRLVAEWEIQFTRRSQSVSSAHKEQRPSSRFLRGLQEQATEYDTDYVKKYEEDLNTTLIFVRRKNASVSFRHLPRMYS